MLYGLRELSNKVICFGTPRNSEEFSARVTAAHTVTE